MEYRRLLLVLLAFLLIFFSRVSHQNVQHLLQAFTVSLNNCFLLEVIDKFCIFCIIFQFIKNQLHVDLE